MLKEHVTGDQQHVGLAVDAQLGDPLDAGLEVLGAVDPAEAVAKVPVGGVDDLHGSESSFKKHRGQLSNRAAGPTRREREPRPPRSGRTGGTGSSPASAHGSSVGTA